MKIAVCGAGEMGTAHFDAFAQVDGVEVMAVSDPDAKRRKRLAGQGVKAYASSEEMLDRSGADAAVIAAPTEHHATLAVQALERGMHVFCEKPMARAVADGRRMIEAARKAGRTLGIGYSLRFHDAYRMAREHVRAGKLGEIGTIRISRCAPMPADWLKDVKANGGAAFEMLTHDLDWLQWTLGPARRIYAQGFAKDADRVERDYVLAVARMASGAVAHLEGSLAEEQDFYHSYEVAGTGGLMSYDSRKAGVLDAHLAGGARASAGAGCGETPFTRQARAFVDAVRQGKRYEVDGEEALPALTLAEAVYESVKSGEAIEL